MSLPNTRASSHQLQFLDTNFAYPVALGGCIVPSNLSLQSQSGVCHVDRKLASCSKEDDVLDCEYDDWREWGLACYAWDPRIYPHIRPVVCDSISLGNTALNFAVLSSVY
eukprot:5670133-Amphidinium_carterae.1